MIEDKYLWDLDNEICVLSMNNIYISSQVKRYVDYIYLLP